ncbi:MULTISPECIES: hypothetical protein [unclassified Campylobacter]|uniref:hypothetical protein n=1 Tax=unclassified Campylobacter TaxID=2593542 RepID=UPI0022E9CBEB|nr:MULTISPECIES: hypothetical protein [unclassified Campylobacter]MDA3043525.1 hypothetical protein [Campylobacter sp. JMF_09 ED2]MDA3052594.1 hypothetical protein [Campylobacter sp. JMF_03 NE3]MDA3071429.1 hypothetical protein [Campylobacter sp. VBCF_03 NA9]MDA3074507.1 hypothetical protein [Campylobacter sp. JMF_05 ED3]
MGNFLKFQGLTFLTLLIFDFCFFLLCSAFLGEFFAFIILGFLNLGFVFKFCLALWKFYKGTYEEEKFSAKFAFAQFAKYFAEALFLGIWLILEAASALFSSLG